MTEYIWGCGWIRINEYTGILLKFKLERVLYINMQNLCICEGQWG